MGLICWGLCTRYSNEADCLRVTLSAAATEGGGGSHVNGRSIRKGSVLQCG
jgi:hypothetical protein